MLTEHNEQKMPYLMYNMLKCANAHHASFKCWPQIAAMYLKEINKVKK